MVQTHPRLAPGASAFPSSTNGIMPDTSYHPKLTEWDPSFTPRMLFVSGTCGSGGRCNSQGSAFRVGILLRCMPYHFSRSRILDNIHRLVYKLPIPHQKGRSLRGTPTARAIGECSTLAIHVHHPLAIPISSLYRQESIQAQ